jgi:hypothetical protein
MRPRILILVVVILLAATAAFWLTRRSKTTSSQSATTTASSPAAAAAAQAATNASSQHAIQLDINHLGLTPERAKLLFSLTVGPLPGVSIDGLTKDPNEFDGTQAVVYLLHGWGALTPEQHQAAAALIYGSSAAKSGRSSALLPDGWAIRPPRVMAAGLGMSPGPNLPAHDYQSLANNANNTIAQMLGTSPIPHIVDVQMQGSLGTEYGHSTSWYPSDPDTGDFKRFPDGKCHTILWDYKFVALDDMSTAAILAHELTHCYQDAWAGTYDNRLAQPRWVADGEANWVAATVVPSGQIIDKDWPQYVYGPKTVYSDRWYDAIGVFGHLSDITGASVVWPRLAPTAVTSQNGDDAATLAAYIQGVAESYFSTWGASYFQSTNYRWKITGPGQPPSSGPAPDDAEINPGTDTMITAAPYQATLTSVSGGSDLLVVALLTGYGRAHDQGWAVDTALDSSGPLVFCLRDQGCKCEDEPDIPLPPEVKQATAPISIGIDGGDQVAQVFLSGHSMNEFCKKKPEKTPPAPAPTPPHNGGGDGGAPDPDDPKKPNPGPGDSIGDPHLRTFDGVRFDFQKIGEYTLVRSTKDDFVVQVRQVPVPGSRAVAVNQSMATKIGGKRVTVSLENSAAVLRIDGTVVTGDPPAMPGISLTRVLTGYGVNYVFEWPDGTVVRAEQIGKYTINVRVKPSASRHGTLEGLLGDDDGSVANDTDAPAPLVEKFLVPSSASLFDYQPGQTSQTFIDASFPDPTSTVPNRDAAERACREQGVTDPQLLHDCVIDFGVTNGFLFANQYAHEQKVLEARASLASMNAKTPAAPKEKIIMMAGEITDKTKPTEFSFQAEANDVIYVQSGPDCVDRSETQILWFVLLSPDKKPMSSSSPGCEMGRHLLPATGTYTIRGNVFKDELGKYSVPIRFLRHDRVAAIKYGDIVSGTIDQRGAHDVYTFTAQAGDFIQISGKGCELSGMFTGIAGPDGGDTLGPICREGTTYKIPKAGTYKLLVNYDDKGPGKYQFVFQGVSSK